MNSIFYIQPYLIHFLVLLTVFYLFASSVAFTFILFIFNFFPNPCFFFLLVYQNSDLIFFAVVDAVDAGAYARQAPQTYQYFFPLNL